MIHDEESTESDCRIPEWMSKRKQLANEKKSWGNFDEERIYFNNNVRYPHGKN